MGKKKARILAGVFKELIEELPPELRNEIIDAMLDEIEKRNVKHSSVMMLCKVVRMILGVPDEDEDQENPI